jgi:hypothetical protein
MGFHEPEQETSNIERRTPNIECCRCAAAGGHIRRSMFDVPFKSARRVSLSRKSLLGED